MPGAGEVRAYRLESGAARVTFLNLGAILQDWQVLAGGAARRVVLGYRDPAAYLDNPQFLGVLAGRVANRISGARLRLGGRDWPLAANEGPNTLHGGPEGIGRQLWEVERDGTRALRFRLQSPHLDQGFPGAVAFEAVVTLEGATLTWDIRARPDRETPVSVAQHSYYALGGGDAPVWDQALTIPAGRYVATDAALLPTGALPSVDGTALDFRRPRTLGAADPEARGTDACLVLDGPAAVTLDAPSGLSLRMETDQPGVQLYTAGALGPGPAPLPGQVHAPFHGVCLEPQGLPDAVNQPAFPGILCSPEAPYRQRLSVRIGSDRASRPG